MRPCTHESHPRAAGGCGSAAAPPHHMGIARPALHRPRPAAQGAGRGSGMDRERTQILGETMQLIADGKGPAALSCSSRACAASSRCTCAVRCTSTLRGEGGSPAPAPARQLAREPLQKGGHVTRNSIHFCSDRGPRHRRHEASRQFWPVGLSHANPTESCSVTCQTGEYLGDINAGVCGPKGVVWCRFSRFGREPPPCNPRRVLIAATLVERCTAKGCSGHGPSQQ